MFILLDIILNILIEHKLFVQNIYPAYQRQPVRNLVSPSKLLPAFQLRNRLSISTLTFDHPTEN